MSDPITRRLDRPMSSISSVATSDPTGAPSVSLAISGMTCGHCVAAVRSALDEVPGVRGAQVAIGAAQVAVDPAAGAPDDVARAAIAAIQEAGYDARLAGARSDAAAPSSSGGL